MIIGKYKFLIITILLISLSNCGFKVVNQSSMMNFSIEEINFTGDKRINYIIKNNLLNFKKEENKKPLYLNLKINKIKSIKEKNIKNEITKYQIEIVAHIDSGERGSKLSRITISKKGEYTVNKQYSQTIRNEKKLVEVLAESLSKEVIFKLSERYNDI